MQWEGQELHTQLFSPNGPAQEVPVSNHLSSRNIKKVLKPQSSPEFQEAFPSHVFCHVYLIL